MLLNRFKTIIQCREIDLDKYKLDLEKNDLLAIIIAAFTSMLPVILLVFSIFSLLVFIFLFK